MQKSEPYKQFGRIVKKRLIDLGMSQRELAKRVGVNENYLTDVLSSNIQTQMQNSIDNANSLKMAIGKFKVN